MTEAEFWEWVENDPREVGAALLVTLDALKAGADLWPAPDAGLVIPAHNTNNATYEWAANARKVLDAFGATT